MCRATGLPEPQAKVQYARACLEAVDEAVMPDLIVPPAILAVAVPRWSRVFRSVR